jgi:hypothetical protein
MTMQMENGKLVLEVVDSEYKGDVKYQWISFTGFLMLFVAPFSDKYDFIIWCFAIGLIIVGGLLMSRRSQFRIQGTIVFFSDRIEMRGDEPCLTNLKDIERVVFYYGGYDGFTKIKFSENGMHNYLFIQTTDGNHLFYQIYLPHKQMFMRLKQYISGVDYRFVYKELSGVVKKMSLPKAIEENRFI